VQYRPVWQLCGHIIGIGKRGGGRERGNEGGAEEEGERGKGKEEKSWGDLREKGRRGEG